MIAPTSSENFYIPRAVGCVFIITAVTTLSTLFFTHIIPLNPPIASLSCGIGFACLNILPLIYAIYLIQHKCTAEQPQPITNHPQQFGTQPPDAFSIEKMLRGHVATYDVQGVKNTLDLIQSKEVLRKVLVPTDNMRAILALATWDSNPKNVEIVKAIISKVKEFDLLGEVLFFTGMYGRQCILSVQNPEAFHVIFEAIGEDVSLLKQVIEYRDPVSCKTLLCYAIEHETKNAGTDPTTTRALLKAAVRVNCLLSLIMDPHEPKGAVFASFGWYGDQVIAEIMSGLTVQDQLRIIQYVQSLQEDGIILQSNTAKAMRHFRWFVYAQTGDVESMKTLLSRDRTLREVKNSEGLTALEIAQKHTQANVIAFLNEK